MQIQIGLALGIFKDPQTKKLLIILSAISWCLSQPHRSAPESLCRCCRLPHRLPLPLHAVPAVLQIASVYFSPTFSLLDLFILLEISLIFDLMIPLQPGIQLMESFLINILQIRVLYSLYRQILFRRKVLTTALIAA